MAARGRTATAGRLRAQLARVARYVAGRIGASLWLRDADARGRAVRCIGSPRIDNAGHLRLGDRVVLHSHVAPIELEVADGAALTLGAGTFVNYGASLRASHGVQLGARVLVGPYTTVADTAAGRAGPIVIEDDVWLGAKCCVLPGVRIGRGAIIGCSARVAADVPPFTVVGGQPARVLRQLDPAKFVVSR